MCRGYGSGVLQRGAARRRDNSCPEVAGVDQRLAVVDRAVLMTRTGGMVCWYRQALDGESSRLYRDRFLQVNSTHFFAFFEIYKTNTPLRGKKMAEPDFLSPKKNLLVSACWRCEDEGLKPRSTRVAGLQM